MSSSFPAIAAAMLSEVGVRRAGEEYDEGADLGKEIGLLLREQHRFPEGDREAEELSMYRSGSAPPSVEGSMAAGLVGTEGVEEEAMADPAYLEYYYSNVNRNPRLPPPALSKEDWRLAQRLQLGGIGDRRKRGENGEKDGDERAERIMSPGGGGVGGGGGGGEWKDKGGEWRDMGGHGPIGLSGLAVRSRQKGLADPFQDKLGRSAQVGHPSRPRSRNAFHNDADTFSSADTQLARSCSNDVSSAEFQCVSGNVQLTSSIQPIGPSASQQTFASVLNTSLSRSTTPDPQLVARVPSPVLPPVGVKMDPTDKNKSSSIDFNNSSSFVESADILAALSGIDLTRNSLAEEDQFKPKLPEGIKNAQPYIFETEGENHTITQNTYPKSMNSGKINTVQQGRFPHPDIGKNGGILDFRNASLTSDVPRDVQRQFASSSDPYLKVPSPNTLTSPINSPSHYRNHDNTNSAFQNFGLNGYGANSPLQSTLTNNIGTGSLPPLFENAAAAASMVSPVLDSRTLGALSLGPNALELQNANRMSNSAAAAGLQMPLVDPLYLQYLRTADYAAQLSPNINNASLDVSYAGSAYVDLLEFQKAYLGSLLSSQNQYNMPFSSKGGNSSQGFYGNPTFSPGISYPGSPLSSPIRTSPGAPGSPMRHGDRNLRYHSALRNSNGASMGSWNFDGIGNIDGPFGSTLLEEFKSNKAKCLELSDIAAHIVEFSADQYGSRFIQQKLETATIEEKNMVFEEIMPHALSLMTDVFGNYVIQKFFEHGTADQIRELANQLTGHVLTLSLQMYGCRVIQKAIEVINLDQQTKMVAELDGHVMRCVRDQNGNHVVQKCIECIPQDAINFIISSFYDQVVNLSMHPYGCRVIQRVLEHCDDPKTQQIVMDEIMQCVCMLAQDQYGNYVVQHVLEHGRPHERSAIIKQLIGQIVQMSQQKFASNVVEKCLTFGTPEERQTLVNEMLGSTDENEPLQAMMKDQFANYVVQKVLETCDDQQRELILSRIKVHLNALKKYTYGKHIVARVEKLVAAGERRIGIQTQYPC